MLIDFIIINEDTQPIIGLKTALAEQLIIVPNINQLETSKTKHISTLESLDDVTKNYYSVFDGLGKIGEKCSIKIDECCAPIINPSRRIPIALKEQVKNKLLEL